MLRLLQNGSLAFGLLLLTHWSASNVARTHYQSSKPEPAVDAVIERIEIPRLHVSARVLEGAGNEELSLGVGHIPGTDWPAITGNVALAGHRDTVFRPLRAIRVGDVVLLETSDKTYEYEVDAIRITMPYDVAAIQPSIAARLTLITCYPFTWTGSAPKRFLVGAKLRRILARTSG